MGDARASSTTRTDDATTEARPASGPGPLSLRIALSTACALVVSMVLYVRHATRVEEALFVVPETTIWLAWAGWTTAVVATFLAPGALAATLLAQLVRRTRRRLVHLAVPLLWAAWTTLVVVLVIIDTRVYETVGLHIWHDVVRHAVDNPGANRELHLAGESTASLSLFTGGVFVLACALWWLAGYLSTRIERRGWTRWRRGLWAAGPAVVASGVLLAVVAGDETDAGAGMGLLGSAPFYDELLGADVDHPIAGETRYPTGTDALQAGEIPAGADVHFVLLESLRGDHFTDALMPNLRARALGENAAAGVGCLTSDRHLAGGHTTEYGTFALLFGLHGYHYEPFARDDVPSLPLRLFAERGYRLVGASASSLIDWNDGDFLFQDFDVYEELLTQPADVGDAEVAERIATARHESDGPLLTFAFFNSTHHNYLYPPEFEVDTPVLPRDYDHFMGDDRLADQRERILNRYRNSVRWIDHLVASHLDAVAEPDDWIVVVGDHGEEFWEHGLLGHGAARFVSERIEVPFLLCGPGIDSERVELSGNVDVWPTLLEAMGVASPDRAWTDGVSLLRDEARPPVWIGGLDFPWDYPDGAFADTEHTFWLRLCPGEALCLEPYMVTDRSDRPVPVDSGSDAIEAVVTGFLDDFDRLVETSY